MNDDQLGEEMAGAYIEIGGIQTGMEQEFLNLVRSTLRDENYVNLVKRRYKIFMEEIKNAHG